MLAKRVLEPNAEVTVQCTVMRAKVSDTWKQPEAAKCLNVLSRNIKRIE